MELGRHGPRILTRSAKIRRLPTADGGQGASEAALHLPERSTLAYHAHMTEFPITPDGLEKLKEELRRLKTERPKISREIGAAIEMGDLSENFEYHSAKDRQGFVEACIRDLEDKVSRATVIDPSKLSGDRVVFGARVTLLDLESDEERVYQIVGETEASIEQGRISVSAPMARALIGKEVGDEVTVPGRGGPRRVEIADVAFPN